MNKYNPADTVYEDLKVLPPQNSYLEFHFRENVLKNVVRYWVTKPFANSRPFKH